MAVAEDLRTLPRWADVVLTGLACWVSLQQAHEMLSPTMELVRAGIIVAASAALLVRHRYPTAVAIAGGAALVAVDAMWPCLIALFQLGVSRPARYAVAVLGATCSAAVLNLFLFGMPLAGVRFVSPVLLLQAAPVLGVFMSSRFQAMRTLKAEVERLRLERELRAEQARQAERSRIAGEMHDLLAHRLSLLVLHAGVLEIRGAQPDLPDRLALLRGTAEKALRELRELLGLLHRSEGHSPVSALPVDLDEVVADSRSGGMAITLSVSGADTDLPASARLAVIRVVQEALTNARKHAPGAPVHVDIVYGTDGPSVSVRNEPPRSDDPAQAPRPGMTTPGAGFGLIGLRARVEALGGCFNAKPLAGGGYLVSAALPSFRVYLQEQQ